MLIKIIFTLFGNVPDSKIFYACSTKLLYFMGYISYHMSPPHCFVSVLPHNGTKSCFITYIASLVHKYIIFIKVKLAVPRLVHKG